jgi:hypothetical protein
VTLLEAFVPAAGDRFDLLDFATASGAFALNLPALPAGLVWNADDLLITGELAVAALGRHSADFNGDGQVDGADFLAWQRGFALVAQTDPTQGDANGDGVVDAADLAAWQAEFGAAAIASANVAVPEPAAGAWLAFLLCGSMAATRPRRRP